MFARFIVISSKCGSRTASDLDAACVPQICRLSLFPTTWQPGDTQTSQMPIFSQPHNYTLVPHNVTVSEIYDAPHKPSSSQPLPTKLRQTFPPKAFSTLSSAHAYLGPMHLPTSNKVSLYYPFCLFCCIQPLFQK